MWHLVLPFSVVPLGIAESRIMGVEGGSNSWFVFPCFSLSHTYTQVIQSMENVLLLSSSSFGHVISLGKLQ